jgi:hypothetical protein
MYMYIEPNRLFMALYFILRGIYKARSDNPRGGPYRAALGVRVPTAHARRVATPSDLINLNQGVRVPWTVPITRPIIFTHCKKLCVNLHKFLCKFLYFTQIFVLILHKKFGKSIDYTIYCVRFYSRFWVNVHTHGVNFFTQMTRVNSTHNIA